jgi:hypothetical protein
LKQCSVFVSVADGVKLPNIDTIEGLYCAGFMQGIINTNLVYQQVLKSSSQFCLPPDGITNTQAARVVVKYLREYPEELHRHEFVLALWAFKAAFPCEKTKR